MSYIPIRLRTLYPNTPLFFDAYIQVGDKYLLYIRNGDDISQDRIDNLKKKRVRRLFINSEHEEKYQEFLDARLNQAMSDNEQSPNEKAEVAVSIASSGVEDMYEDPESHQVFLLLEKAAEGIVKIVGKKTDVLGLFMKRVRNSNAEPIIQHALNVASLTSCLAEYLGLPDKTVQDLSVAALLMDVGMIKLPENARETFFKKRQDIALDEWKVFATHPEVSRDILQGKDYVNRQILELVYTHEEMISGEGFPQKLTKLSLEQGILGLCACFDRQVTFHGMTYKEALEEISINQLGNFDLKLIKKLKDALKVQSLE